MHRPVLLKESIDALKLKKGEVYLDGTLGSGGHSAEVAKRFKDSVTIIAIDRDPDAVKRSRGKLEEFTTNFKLFNESFRNLDTVLGEAGIESVDAILFDLGLSSDQLSPPAGGSGRGFSFLRDEPLDMRMSGTGPTAADILNSWDEHAIELILRGFGEEKFSRKIASAIVERRKIKPFETTFDLVGTVLEIKKRTWKDRIHPATQTFQAIRIAVNEELTALEVGLQKGFEVLKPGGRFAVISFHSLEDRMVKNFFRDKVKEEVAKHITKKPATASAEEVEENPRSRSAKLRIIEKDDKKI